MTVTDSDRPATSVPDAEPPTVAPATVVGTRPESLASLLGGGRAALDATLPVIAFTAAWLLTDRSVLWGAFASIVVAVLVALWRLRSGRRPSAVLIGILAVCASAAIAVYTGRPEHFFLLQILANVASAVAWTLSI